MAGVILTAVSSYSELFGVVFTFASLRHNKVISSLLIRINHSVRGRYLVLVPWWCAMLTAALLLALVKMTFRFWIAVNRRKFPPSG